MKEKKAQMYVMNIQTIFINNNICKDFNYFILITFVFITNHF